MTDFAGLCVGGPKDGTYMIAQQSRIEYVEKIGDDPVYGGGIHQPSPELRRGCYMFHEFMVEGNLIKGFWHPMGMGVCAVFEKLIEGYSPKVTNEQE